MHFHPVAGRDFRLVQSLFAFAAVSVAVVNTSGATLTDAQQDMVRRAERHEKHGWTYLHIEGGPRARGFQHGYLLAREIAGELRVRRVLWQNASGME